MTDNLILRKGISFLLILALIFSGFFVTTNQVQAETQTITTIKTEKFDDLAYYDVWKHEDGTWQKGIKPGSSASQTYTITESVVPEGAKIISVTGNVQLVAASYYNFLYPIMSNQRECLTKVNLFNDKT